MFSIRDFQDLVHHFCVGNHIVTFLHGHCSQSFMIVSKIIALRLEVYRKVKLLLEGSSVNLSVYSLKVRMYDFTQ